MFTSFSIKKEIFDLQGRQTDTELELPNKISFLTIML